MLIRERMMAHAALKELMLRRDRPAIAPDTMGIIYETILQAECDDAFANDLDLAFADSFADDTADGLSDLLTAFEDMPTRIYDTLKRKRII